MKFENNIFMLLKILNLGIFILVYGIVVFFLIKYEEIVKIVNGDVKIYFLMEEEKDVMF